MMIIQYPQGDFEIPSATMQPEQFQEEQDLRDLYWRPGPGEVAVDVGCGVGSYAIPALLAGAEVVAVDPHPHFLATITSLCDLNQVGTSRLTLVPQALSAPGGYTDGFWQGMAGTTWPYLLADRGSVFTTLDDLAAQLRLDRLDWLKIDVEGAELGVLQGGLGSLRRWHPKLLIEDHTRVYPFVAQMGSRQSCVDLLADAGYQVQLIPYAPDRMVPRDYLVGEV